MFNMQVGASAGAECKVVLQESWKRWRLHVFSGWCCCFSCKFCDFSFNLWSFPSLVFRFIM